MLMKNKLFCSVIGALKRLTIMITRYAGKYRRSPYPQATRTKHNLLITGGDVLASLLDKSFFLLEGTTIFTEGTCLPHPPTRIDWVNDGPHPHIKRAVGGTSL